MCFVISYLEGEETVESTLLEDFDYKVMEKMVPAISRVINEKHSTRVLLDWRKGKIAMSTIEIYDLPRRLKMEFEKYGVNILGLKRAYLINEIDADSYFFETVMKNNSQTFNIFLDREKAINWLTGK